MCDLLCKLYIIRIILFRRPIKIAYYNVCWSDRTVREGYDIIYPLGCSVNLSRDVDYICRRLKNTHTIVDFTF